MLRSMQNQPRPTRAEATDVANAVLDGTDAVMLSEETAIGRYPVEAVTMMAAIVADAESIVPVAAWTPPPETIGSLPDAVGRDACILATDIDAVAIVTCTQSGTTARRVARYRPRAPILAPTPHAETYRRLALVWGLEPRLGKEPTSLEDVTNDAVSSAMDYGLAEPGQRILILAGTPFGAPGAANLLRLAHAPAKKGRK